VRAALKRGEPSPLAAAWRDVCESYARTHEQDGSTATAVLIADDGRCEVLNVGDSRSVLARGGGGGGGGDPSVVLATRDHSPGDVLESDRIRAFGGEVACSTGGAWRVKVISTEGLFQVAVARSLGGSEWRGAGISNAADLSTLSLEELHGGFIVLASDGIWGPLDSTGATAAERSEGVARRVCASRARGESASRIAQELVQAAAAAGGTDNACSIVILL